jgi:hypothetical protein
LVTWQQCHVVIVVVVVGLAWWALVTWQRCHVVVIVGLAWWALVTWQRCHVVVVVGLAWLPVIPPLLFLSVSTPISPCEQWLAGWVVVLET